jgi:hypothetical protein
MHITMDLSQSLVDDLMKLLKVRKVEDAVRVALEEFVKLKKTEGILALPANIKISDVTSELEKMEVEESNAKV